MEQRGAGHDRLLGATRAVAGLVVPVLAVAGVLLYAFPDRTEALWAWPINPPLTALAVGGGYLAGAVLFARMLADGRWHAAAVGWAGAATLATLLLIATVLHWDKFTHGHPSFWAWLALYVVTPWLLPLLWVRNRAASGAGPAGGRIVHPAVRRAVGALGAVQLVGALLMFAFPQPVVDLWPWTLSPLTARTLASFFAFLAVAGLAFLVEPRWSALRLHVGSAALGLALVAGGALRSPEDLTGPAWSVAAFVVLLTGSLAGLGILLVVYRGDPQAARPPPPTLGA